MVVSAFGQFSKRLKTINAIFQKPDTGVIERYAAISELTLQVDVRQVGLLTAGLLDSNIQVRELAASQLGDHYQLAETSRDVFTLLEEDRQNLRNAVYFREPEPFRTLLENIGQLLRDGRIEIKEGEAIDYERRHALIILEYLGKWVRHDQEQALTSTGLHPLRELLEEKTNAWILPLILTALRESPDIFCRRAALRVIGELDLRFPTHSSNEEAFEIIRTAVDAKDNYNDFMVTHDALKSLAINVLRNPDKAEPFYQLVRSFFNDRQYDMGSQELSISKRYDTKLHCIQAIELLGTSQDFQVYDLLKLLLEDGKRNNFLDMTKPTILKNVPKTGVVHEAIIRVKLALLDNFARFYLADSQPGQHTMSVRQQEILTSMSTWVSSKERKVQEKAIRFFADHSITTQALDSLLKEAEENGRNIPRFVDKYTWAEAKTVLEDRQQLITVLGIILARTSDASTISSEREANIGMWKKMTQYLKEWCIEQVTDANGEAWYAYESCRLNALWTLYDLCAHTPNMAPLWEEWNMLSLEEIATLREATAARNENMESQSLRIVLELFRAYKQGANFLTELQSILQSQAGIYVKVCVEMEYCIQIEQQRLTSLSNLELSESIVKFFSGQAKPWKVLHASLFGRFLPILAKIEDSKAIELARHLIKIFDMEEKLRIHYREQLSDTQCYHLREDLLELIKHDLLYRHKHPKNIQLDYLNLFRAGPSYLWGEDTDEEPPHRADQSNQGRILAALQDITGNFDQRKLSVLDTQKMERVVALTPFPHNGLYNVLYAEDSNTEATAVQWYFSTQSQSADCWILLDRVKSDREILDTLLSGMKRSGPRWEAPHHTYYDKALCNAIEKAVAGRVISTHTEGVYVDIGLYQLRPFVSKIHMVSPDSELRQSEYWPGYAKSLVGKILPFRVQSITIDNHTNEITDIQLARDLSEANLLEDRLENYPDRTVQAKLRRIDCDDKHNPQVIFDREDGEIRVPLRELSWRSQYKWIHEEGWLHHFEKKKGQTFELKHNGKSWSLRECTPTLENFMRLLYQHGPSKFELIYVKPTPQGYVFESEPGQNCYVPADRLIDIQQPGKPFPQFLLPSRDIHEGDLFHVQFKQTPVDGVPEVLLHFLNKEGNPIHDEIFTKGREISGHLKRLEKSGEGLVEPDDTRLKDYTIKISHLSIDEVSIGSQLTGILEEFNYYNREIGLIYAITLPEEIQMERSYPCRIRYEPQATDKYLALRYAYVDGQLYENQMTYGHSPVFTDPRFAYHRGQMLMARRLPKESLQWRQQGYATLKTSKDSNQLNGLKLEEYGSIEADVISYRNRKLVARSKDNVTLSLSLDEFECDNSELRIYPGNRITIARGQKTDLSLCVQSASLLMTILPRLEQRYDSKWSDIWQILKPGHTMQCIFLACRGNEPETGYYLLEARPGVVCTLPFANLEQAMYWKEGQGRRWRLTHEYSRVEVARTRDGLEQASAIYALSIGDVLTLRCNEAGDAFQIEEYTPGPLHLAAVSWILDTNTTQTTHLIGRISPTAGTGKGGKDETSKRVEITDVVINNRRIRLRGGIFGFYRQCDMTPQDREAFRMDALHGEVKLILVSPPELRGNRLFLALRGFTTKEDLPHPLEQPQQAEEDFLRQILEELEREARGRTLPGKIVRYDKKRQTFHVQLDTLANVAHQCTCLLPEKWVSENAVSSYQSIEAFDDDLRKMFTVISIDAEHMEIEVSLIDNQPIPLDEAGREYEWHDGKEIKHAVFLGALTLDENIPHTEGTQEEGERVPGETEAEIDTLVGIEVLPGLKVEVSTERLLYGDLPYRMALKDFPLQKGDQIKLCVIKQGYQFKLNIINATTSDASKITNPRRIVTGLVSPPVHGKIPLYLDEYPKLRVPCFIDPTVETPFEVLLKYDLFRVVESPFPVNELYFQPVAVDGLQKDDLLQVTFKNIQSDITRFLPVQFGRNMYDGRVFLSGMSYQANIDLKRFQRQGSCEARLVRDMKLGAIPHFSIKEIALQLLSAYFDTLERQKGVNQFFTVVLVGNKQTIYMDIEVDPGVILRVPDRMIQVSPKVPYKLHELKERLKVGDTLQLKIANSAGQRYLVLTGFEKSPLHYLYKNMLVRAHFVKRSAKHLEFSLPDYTDIKGLLELPEHQSQNVWPELFRSDLRLVVDTAYIKDPTDPIYLRQRELFDTVNLVRVESIEANALTVYRENGFSVRIPTILATYRIDKRISYLQRSLHPGEILFAQQEKSFNGSPSFRGMCFSLLRNKPVPLSLRVKDLELEQGLLELTYVRCHEETCDFELRPGLLIAVPRSALSFCHKQMQCPERFLPGDVFIVRIERTGQQKQEKLKLEVQDIQLSLLHSWSFNQYVKAEVVETFDQGIQIKAGPLEGYVENFLPEHSSSSFKEGDKLWLKVVRLYRDERSIVSGNFLALEEVPFPSEEDNTEKLYTLYATIVRDNQLNGNDSWLTVALPEQEGTAFPLPPEAFAWTFAKKAKYLFQEDENVWASVSATPTGKLYIDLKRSQYPTIQRLAALEGKIIQAKVIKLNSDSDDPAKPPIIRVLLSVDGIRVLVFNTDIAWGMPKDLPGAIEAQWLPVRITNIKLPDREKQDGRLEVSVREVDDELKNLPVGARPYDGTVLYTLPHGLVFVYQNSRGYIPNKELAWSPHAEAQTLFVPGDSVTFYKIAQYHQSAPFSLKHLSHVGDLKRGDEIEMIIHCKTADGYYIKAAGSQTRLLTYIASDQPVFAYLDKMEQEPSIILQVGVKIASMTASFSTPKKQEVEGTDVVQSTLPDSSTLLDRIYLLSITNFQNRLREIKILRDLENADSADDWEGSALTSVHPDEEQEAVQTIINTLNTRKFVIPCTYRHIRWMLRGLWENYPQVSFWNQLACYRTSDMDSSMVQVLQSVAETLSRDKYTDQAGQQPSNLAVFHHYAVGICPLFQNPPETLSSSIAIEYLLDAYKDERALDIQIALLIHYEAMQAFEMRNVILEQIVQSIAQNVKYLLELPQPLYIHLYSYPRHTIDYVEGLQERLSSVENKLRKILENHLKKGEIELAKQELKKMWERSQIILPELNINLALCHIFQGTLEEALPYLDPLTDFFRQAEPKYHQEAREIYYQLKIYIYYHLKRFQEIQDMLIADLKSYNFSQSGGSWLQTWLGYIFFQSKKYELSEIVIAPGGVLSPHPRLEQMLLYLYWQRIKQEQPAPLPYIGQLRSSLFYNLKPYGSTWQQVGIQVHLSPPPEQVDYAGNLDDYIYAIPDFVLKHYWQDSQHSEKRKYLANKSSVSQLITMALLTGEIQKAVSIADDYFRQARRAGNSEEAANLLINLYRELMLDEELEKFLEGNFLYGKYRTGEEREQKKATVARVRGLIEQWMKSSTSRVQAGTRLATFFAKSSRLCMFYWSHRETRQQIWQVLDAGIDYAILPWLLPEQVFDELAEEVKLEVLEEIVVHLLAVGRNWSALKRIQNTAELYKDTSYLHVLQQLCQERPSARFYRKLHYLCQRVGTRLLVFYEENESGRTERNSAIEALMVLEHVPDPERQVRALLQAGELLETEQRYHEASRKFEQLVVTLPDISFSMQWLAAIRLLRLHILQGDNQDDSISSTILPLLKYDTAFYALFSSLIKLARLMQTPIERFRFAEFSGRLCILIETLNAMHTFEPGQQQEQYRIFLSQVETCLYTLYHVPSGKECLVPLYKFVTKTDCYDSLVKTEPFTGFIQDMLTYFIDFSLATHAYADLQPHIAATMDSLISGYEYRAAKTSWGSTQLSNSKQWKGYFIDSAESDTPQSILQKMSKHPEKIANTLLKFLEKKRLSAQVVHQVTLQLQYEGSILRSHVGQNFRSLLLYALLAHNRRNEAYTLIDELQNVRVLLHLAIESVAHDEIDITKNIQRKIQDKVSPYEREMLDLVLGYWTTLEHAIQDSQRQNERLRKIVSFLLNRGYEKLALTLLQRTEEMLSTPFDETARWLYVKSALLHNVELAEAYRLITEALAADPTYQFSFEDAHCLTIFLCGQTPDNSILQVKLLKGIVAQQQHSNSKPFLQEMLVRELAFAQNNAFFWRNSEG